GFTATLTVVATSGASPPLIYQWFKDDSSDPIPGETSASCCSGSNAINTSGRYYARIINSCGKIDSNSVYVRVCGRPSISSQPLSTQIASGLTAPLSVSATGCSLTYQWYQGNQDDTSGGIKGTGPAFTTPPLTATTS